MDLPHLYGVLVEGDVHLVADLLHLRPGQRLGAKVPAENAEKNEQTKPRLGCKLRKKTLVGDVVQRMGLPELNRTRAESYTATRYADR